jgi:hypothetical protein
MHMSSIATETGNNAGMSLPARVEKVTTLVQPIEFEPNQCATLGNERGHEFSEELV